MMIKTPNLLVIGLSSLFISACGGSSSDPETPTPPSDLTWVANNFQPSSAYKDFCAVQRSGSDPFTGETYTDKSGSLNHEKFWLRSFNHETYLWYSEVDDQDPANFATPQDYFDVLKTTEKTDSGADKDNFHWSENTASYRERTLGGTSSGYGIRWKFIQSTPPRELRVAFTELNSPAVQAGILRGDKVLSVDGVDLINGNDVDTLNAGLFPTNDGEQHTLVVESVLGEQRTITLTSAQVAVEPVHNTQVIDHNGTKVGYLQFNTHIAKAQQGLIDAITQFSNQNVQELVVDLRYNGGGLLALASQFSYMVAGDVNTQNGFFEQLIYNDKTAARAPTPFYNKVIDYDAGVLTSTNLPTVALNKVYVLSSASTCSASESFINGLLGIDVEVVLIGDKTCGKPYGFVPQDNCSTTYFTIQFAGVNNKGFGEYSDGLTPTEDPQFAADVKGCQATDDLTQPLGNPAEGMLSSALYHIETGSCPSNKLSINNSLSKTNTATKKGKAIFDPFSHNNKMTLNNKIITPINNP